MARGRPVEHIKPWAPGQATVSAKDRNDLVEAIKWKNRRDIVVPEQGGGDAASGGGNHNILSATHSDSDGDPGPSQGDLLRYNESGKWEVLSGPQLGRGLHNDSGDTVWRYGYGFHAYTSSEQSVSDEAEDRIQFASVYHDADSIWDAINYEADINGLVSAFINLEWTGGGEGYVYVRIYTEVSEGDDALLRSWRCFPYLNISFTALLAPTEISGNLYWTVYNDSDATASFNADGGMHTVS